MGEVGDFTIVGLVIAISFFLIVFYDIYLYLTDKPTLSVVIHKWGWNKPWIAFAAGFICGHWFW